MSFPRHTLVDLAPAARDALAGVVADRLLPPFRRADLRDKVAACFAAHDVPGIACRPTEAMSPNHVQLGISLPFRDDGARVRALIAIDADTIAGHRSPYEVMAGPVPDGFRFARLIGDLTRAARDNAVQLGAFGSVALQLATGLDYVGAESDVDLVVRAEDADGLAEFVAITGALGRQYSVRLDIEVELVNGYGVKAKELCSTSRTVLGRSLADVRLLERDEALQAIGLGASSIHPAAPLSASNLTRSEQWN